MRELISLEVREWVISRAVICMFSVGISQSSVDGLAKISTLMLFPEVFLELPVIDGENKLTWGFD